MAYTNQTQDPRRRATAVAVVIGVHTALALALLSMGVVVIEDRPTTSGPYTLTPDPEPTPPPKPEKTAEQTDSVITAPETSFEKLNQADDSVRVNETTVGDWPEAEVVPVVPPLPTPRPSPSCTPKSAVPTNQPGSWISTDDYPARQLRDEVEGMARYRAIIGSGGRVSSCEITSSTGNRALDEATCRLISRRARFEAATDGCGASVVGNYSGTVRWEIPD